MTENLQTEIPYDRLHIRPVPAVVLAERQGFDDGYFLNEKQSNFKNPDLLIAYNAGYVAGVAQRPGATPPPVAPPPKRKKKR